MHAALCVPDLRPSGAVILEDTGLQLRCARTGSCEPTYTATPLEDRACLTRYGGRSDRGPVTETAETASESQTCAFDAADAPCMFPTMTGTSGRVSSRS